MKNYLDGGEAILEAFRKLKIDYIMSSPGSEWSPIWEALARQQLGNKPGPTFVESWHETLAVNMASGYTLITGRPQAVLLHAGLREVPPAPTVQPRPADVERVAELLRNCKSPVIVTETAGRDPDAFSALVELADLLAIAVINGRTNAYANFPTNHQLYLGMGNYQALDDADLVLLVGGRAPWYPPRR